MQYDEIGYGKLIKENGFQSDNIKMDLLILSKYLRHIDNMKLSRHKEFVYDFCKKNIIDFNEVLHFKVVDSSIRNGRKRDNMPIRVSSIEIHEKYLIKIDKENVPDDYKKVLLTMLVHTMISLEKKKPKKWKR